MKLHFIFFALLLISAVAQGQEQRYVQSEELSLRGDLIFPLDSKTFSPSVEVVTRLVNDSEAEQMARQKCVIDISQGIKEMTTNMRLINHPMLVGRDLQLSCRSLILSGVPGRFQLTNGGLGPERTLVIIPIPREVTTKFANVSGVEITIGCEQRTLKEQVVYQNSAQCKLQRSPNCLDPDFLQEEARLGPTRYIRQVTPEFLCGLSEKK